MSNGEVCDYKGITEIDVKEPAHAFTLKRRLNSYFRSRPDLEHVEVKASKTKKTVTVIGASHDDVDKGIGKSTNLVSNLVYNEILGEQTEIKECKDIEEVYREINILKGRYKKACDERENLIQENIGLQGEIRELRKEVVSDKETYKSELEKVINDKNELKENLSEKMSMLEETLKNGSKDPFSLLLHSVYLEAKSLEKECDSYKQSIEQVRLISNLKEQGLDLEPILGKLKDENEAESFEGTQYFKDRVEKYESAKIDLKFLEEYHSDKKFDVPEKHLKTIVSSLDKDELIKTKSEFEAAREVFGILKENNFDMCLDNTLEKDRTISYLVHLSSDTDAYNVCVVVPVPDKHEEDLSNDLSNEILSYFELVDGDIFYMDQDTLEVNGEKLVCYKKKLSKKDMHKGTLKSKIKKLKNGLRNLPEDSTLANAGFKVKVNSLGDFE